MGGSQSGIDCLLEIPFLISCMPIPVADNPHGDPKFIGNLLRCEGDNLLKWLDCLDFLPFVQVLLDLKQ